MEQPDPALLPDLYAVILAGGSGTRFWPASRREKPKQYLRIASGLPILTETWLRLEGLVPSERVLVVTTEDQAASVRRVLPELPPENVLSEPEGRNTAAATALAAFEIRRRAPDSLQLVLPADHVIRPRKAFHRTIAAGAVEANELGSLVIFGIQPTWPATGFGYIEAGEQVRAVHDLPVFRVERFVEKPDEARARAFLDQGGFFWNAGIFLWHTDAICRAIAEYLPDAYAGLSKQRRGAELASIYAALPAVSVDVAILEQAPGVRMLPIDYAWSDVGSWNALSEVHEPDQDGNVVCGGAEVETLDASGCIVHGDAGELTALIGVEDLIVVHSGNATLVCHRDRAQDVKLLVERMQREGRGYL